MTRLNIDNARLRFDDQIRLGPLSLDLPLTGITAVLGPNGAGKSLFLALSHGTMISETGSVTWEGAPAATTRRQRGFMLQSTVILRRTVAANLAFALNSTAVPKSEQAAKITAALCHARLTDRASAPAATLSGGELRRMNLARALVTDPDVLLLDEPFAGLDPASTQAMETIIVETARTTPVLLSNHDLAQSRRIATRVLFFTEGQLAENALASDFFSQPQSAQARSFLQGQLL